jgi:hypothetical protein
MYVYRGDVYVCVIPALIRKADDVPINPRSGGA